MSRIEIELFNYIDMTSLTIDLERVQSFLNKHQSVRNYPSKKDYYLSFVLSRRIVRLYWSHPVVQQSH
jgi:hypothetical protein